MRCYHCNKRISIVKRFVRNRILRKNVYTLMVNETKEIYPLCDDCGKIYEYIVELVNVYGQDAVIDALKDLNKDKE